MDRDRWMRTFVNNNRMEFLSCMETEIFAQGFPGLLPHNREQISSRLRHESTLSANSLLLHSIERIDNFPRKFITFCDEHDCNHQLKDIMARGLAEYNNRFGNRGPRQSSTLRDRQSQPSAMTVPYPAAANEDGNSVNLEELGNVTNRQNERSEERTTEQEGLVNARDDHKGSTYTRNDTENDGVNDKEGGNDNLVEGNQFDNNTEGAVGGVESTSPPVLCPHSSEQREDTAENCRSPVSMLSSRGSRSMPAGITQEVDNIDHKNKFKKQSEGNKHVQIDGAVIGQGVQRLTSSRVSGADNTQITFLQTYYDKDRVLNGARNTARDETAIDRMERVIEENENAQDTISSSSSFYLSSSAVENAITQSAHTQMENLKISPNELLTGDDSSFYLSSSAVENAITQSAHTQMESLKISPNELLTGDDGVIRRGIQCQEDVQMRRPNENPEAFSINSTKKMVNGGAAQCQEDLEKHEYNKGMCDGMFKGPDERKDRNDRVIRSTVIAESPITDIKRVLPSEEMSSGNDSQDLSSQLFECETQVKIIDGGSTTDGETDELSKPTSEKIMDLSDEEPRSDSPVFHAGKETDDFVVTSAIQSSPEQHDRDTSWVTDSYGHVPSRLLQMPGPDLTTNDEDSTVIPSNDFVNTVATPESQEQCQDNTVRNLHDEAQGITQPFLPNDVVEGLSSTLVSEMNISAADFQASEITSQPTTFEDNNTNGSGAMPSRFFPVLRTVAHYFPELHIKL